VDPEISLSFSGGSRHKLGKFTFCGSIDNGVSADSKLRLILDVGDAWLGWGTPRASARDKETGGISEKPQGIGKGH